MDFQRIYKVTGPWHALYSFDTHVETWSPPKTGSQEADFEIQKSGFRAPLPASIISDMGNLKEFNAAPATTPTLHPES